MDSIMDSPDLDSLFSNIEEKISTICSKLSLYELYLVGDKEQSVYYNNMISSVQTMLDTMEQNLAQLEAQYESKVSRLSALLVAVQNHYEHVAKNIDVIKSKY